jgi:hypothetical protein
MSRTFVLIFYSTLRSRSGRGEAASGVYQPGGRGNVRRAILGTVEHWKIGKPTPHAEAAKVLVQGFLMNGVRRVEWTALVDTLRGGDKN